MPISRRSCCRKVRGIILLISFLLASQTGYTGGLEDSVHLAILNAREYFQQHGQTYEPKYIPAILQFLQRKFNDTAWATDSVPRIPTTGFQPDSGFSIFNRMYDPEYRTPSRDSIRKWPNEIDRFTLMCMYCDQDGPGYAVFSERISLFIPRNNYYATHALLGLVWLKENACFPGDTVLLRDEIKLIKKVTQILESTKSPDLLAEAAAMLMYNGNYTQVSPEIIRKLMELQLPGGGWPGEAREVTPSDHTSALAWWALLEFMYPQAPKHRWLFP